MQFTDRPEEAGGKTNPLIAEPNSFISELWDYWNFKWEKGCDEYDQSKRLEGVWKYVSFGAHDTPVYEGNCFIEEETGSLRATGVRNLTYLEEGKPITTHIEWKTNVMHKYTSGGELCLITSHYCFPQSGEMAAKGVTAFMTLTLKDPDHNQHLRDIESTEAPARLEGSFFVTGQTGDPLFQARTGRVIFTRC